MFIPYHHDLVVWLCVRWLLVSWGFWHGSSVPLPLQLRAKCAGSHVSSQTWSVSFHFTRYWRQPSRTQLFTTASTSYLLSQLGIRSFPANIGETCCSPQNGSNRMTLNTLYTFLLAGISSSYNDQLITRHILNGPSFFQCSFFVCLSTETFFSFTSTRSPSINVMSVRCWL